jgi:cytochrome c oxidase assembly protein subunit 11
MNQNDHDLIKKNQRTGFIVLAIVVGMIGLSFASVPLYRLFCQITGFGGMPIRVDQSQTASKILDRDMTVRFNTDVNADLPWSFKADAPQVTLNIGQNVIVSFTAKNTSNVPEAGTAIFNVTPLSASKYFHKTQCFCFNYQMIGVGDEAHFPVAFYIDPAIEDDPELDDLKTITLSYTFFRADSPALENALEDFYKSSNSGTKAIPIN